MIFLRKTANFVAASALKVGGMNFPLINKS